MTTLIDIHSHLYPEWYLDVVRDRHVSPRVEPLSEGRERFVIFPNEEGPPLTSDYWDVKQKLEFMDALGIDQSVISLGNPWLQWIDDDVVAQDYAERLNAWLSGLGETTGARLVGMGVLPEADVATTAAYATRLRTVHGLTSVVVGSTLCGLELDDPALDDVYAALEHGDIAMFVHPHHSLGAERLSGYGPALQVALGFPSETALALGRLLLGGVLDRFPKLNVVASHGGGSIAMLAGRFIGAAGAHLPNEDRSGTRVDGLLRLYVDSIVYAPAALQLILGTFGDQHVMFGTDHPFYLAHHPAVSGIVEHVPADLRDAVTSATARRLFHVPEIIREPHTTR